MLAIERTKLPIDESWLPDFVTKGLRRCGTLLSMTKFHYLTIIMNLYRINEIGVAPLSLI